jgi:hypothetical protein
MELHGGNSALNFWPFSGEQREFIDHFGSSIEKRTLECFGTPPLAFVAA